MFQTIVAEKITTHFMFNNVFFSPDNRAVYEIVWKNIAESDKPQMTKHNKAHAHWMLDT